MNTKEKIENRIATSPDSVFLKSDFADVTGSAAVGRALAALIRDGVIVRVGLGVYCKARISSLTGKPIPCVSMVEIGDAILRKLGIQATLAESALDYLDGRSTQVPARERLCIGAAKFSRQIGFGKRVLRVERGGDPAAFCRVARIRNPLMSRADAKIVSARFLGAVTAVNLDFEGVEEIGRSFADELFRVWPLANPAARVVVRGAGPAVLQVLKGVMARTDLPQPLRPVEVEISSN